MKLAEGSLYRPAPSIMNGMSVNALTTAVHNMLRDFGLLSNDLTFVELRQIVQTGRDLMLAHRADFVQVMTWLLLNVGVPARV
jgi:hypothetical protein